MTDYRPNIWRLQAQFDTKGLIGALSHDEPGIRRRAAIALRALGDTSAVPALKAALELEQDTETRASIVAALEQLHQEQEPKPDETSEQSLEQNKVALLIGQLGSKQPERMIAAARELGRLKDKLAAEPLVMVFNNLSLPVKARLAAAEALLELDSAPVEVTLLAALRHTDWHIRRNAAAILAQLHADWAVEPLSKALHDDHDLVRRTARAALRYIGTAEALQSLKAASGSAATLAEDTHEQLTAADVEVLQTSPMMNDAPLTNAISKPDVPLSKKARMKAALESSLGKAPIPPSAKPPTEPRRPETPLRPVDTPPVPQPEQPGDLSKKAQMQAKFEAAFGKMPVQPPAKPDSDTPAASASQAEAASIQPPESVTPVPPSPASTQSAAPEQQVIPPAPPTESTLPPASNETAEEMALLKPPPTLPALPTPAPPKSDAALDSSKAAPDEKP